MMLPRTLMVMALAASSLAWGEPLDSPGRIARLGYVEGQMAFFAAQEQASSALPDRPLIPGDRLVTETGGRAEFALGTATVRLDERSELAVVDLGTTAVRLELARGIATIHLYELLEDETFEVVTPNTTITFDASGEYRVDSAANGMTDLTVHSGVASLATADGAVRVAAGQRVRLEGRNAYAALAAPQPADDFDEWVLERELQLTHAEPSRYGLGEGEGYDELDRYGEWYDEPSYGRVWMPSYAYGGYDPFRYGYWERVGLYGRSWRHSAPWGFHTFHGGRWAYLDHLNRWCWVPTRRHRDDWDHHDRDRVAHDTAPFRQPRGDGRPTDDGKDRPVVRPRRDDAQREPVATFQGSPRRIDSDRAPVWRRDAAPIKPTRAASPAPRVNRDPPAPERSASAPQGGTTTMRPSRPAESRREAASPPPTRNSREVGTLRTP